jgi:hypothetical protein
LYARVVVRERHDHAATVSILATSREALGVRGEHIAVGVAPSADAAGAVSVLASEAEALFVARVRRGVNWLST